MNSMSNISLNSTKKVLNSISNALSISCYHSLNSINKEIKDISLNNIIIHNNNYSLISSLYPQNFKYIQPQLKYYSTNKNQDSCNIQNACSSGIESNSSSSESSKKFNNHETPFDIRHEGALTPMEKLLLNKLKNNFEPSAIIKVKDISDGCGSLYMVDITSTKFDDLMMVKQHRIVMDILQEELKTWHGIHIVTHPVHKRRRRRRNNKKD